MGRLQRSGQSWSRFSLKLPPSAQCSSGCCRGVLLLLTEVGITWELLCTLHMAHHTACFFSLLVTCSRMDCVCSVVVLINSFVVVKIFFNTHMYPIKQTGRKGQKVKDDGTHFFWCLDGCWIDGQKALGCGYRTCSVQGELQVQGQPLSLGMCYIHRQCWCRVITDSWPAVASLQKPQEMWCQFWIVSWILKGLKAVWIISKENKCRVLQGRMAGCWMSAVPRSCWPLHSAALVTQQWSLFL